MFNEKWINEKVKIKENRVVVKLVDSEKKFRDSVIIPTEYYPLKDTNFEVYHKNNCEEIKDKKVIEIFNSIEYRIGYCYQNSENLVNRLKENGYNAKQYCGWLFIDNESIPNFHSWVILNNSLLDLADEFNVLYHINPMNWNDVTTKEEQIKVLADFHLYIKKNKISNSDRCNIVGIPTIGLMYVGGECSAKDGRSVYNNMMRRFPNHASYKKGDERGNETQQYIYEKIK